MDAELDKMTAKLIAMTDQEFCYLKDHILDLHKALDCPVLITKRAGLKLCTVPDWAFDLISRSASVLFAKVVAEVKQESGEQDDFEKADDHKD